MIGMTQRNARYWLAGAYYIEWDQQNQLRIAGPDNHLYFGSIGLDPAQIKVTSVATVKDELVMELEVKGSKLVFADPAMGHIRKVRSLIESSGPDHPTFAEVVRQQPGVLVPNFILAENNVISYRRDYDGNAYGIVITVPKTATVSRDDKNHAFLIETKSKSFKLKLESVTHYAKDHPHRGYDGAMFKDSAQHNELLTRTAAEITHLVRHNKTSGFDYGTVFPRDWMEAADLGVGDLDVGALAYMYHKAIEFTDHDGEGWHENIVGEFAAERKDEINELAGALDELVGDSYPERFDARRYVQAMEDIFVVRNMVDIEPHYLLGLETVPSSKWSEHDLSLLSRVAHYIMRQAEDNALITFKKMPSKLRRHKHEEYYGAGNWRDSTLAYQVVSPIVAPYDVNVVFYPQALRLIRQHAVLLKADLKRVDKLIRKWSKVDDKYRFVNSDGSTAYALALYDVEQTADKATYKTLCVNHTDEAYNLFYGQPDEATLVSFAERLLDPAYFYTASGPTVVGHGEGYDTTYYHGEVIWTKQTAFIVAGLYRQLERTDTTWQPETKTLITKAALATAKANLEAVRKLGVVPELHYDLKGVPHLYDDQPEAEGPMNAVQLWSAVGIRRIMRIYNELTK
jgi:hypothetical protein